MAYSLSNF